MGNYVYFEHTADIGIEATGHSLAEAFEQAALGMFGLMVQLDTVRPETIRTVQVDADDIEALLFEWLNTLIYHVDAENLLFSQFSITAFSGNHLSAVCRGEKYDPSRHEIKTVVKSATYHELTVDAQRHSLRVIIDI